MSIVKIRWNKYIERWVLLKENSKNMWELPDCDNFNALFPGLNKSAVNIYEVQQGKKIGETNE